VKLDGVLVPILKAAPRHLLNVGHRKPRDEH